MDMEQIAKGAFVTSVVGGFYAALAGVPGIPFTGVFDVAQIVNTYPEATGLAGSVTVLSVLNHWFSF